jgi:HEAT repeat protein
MRKISILSLLVLYLVSQPLIGQDRRTLETKIADLLVQMPVSDLSYRDKLAEETYGLGEEGLVQICSKVLPPGTADDTPARLAIESLSKYLSREVPSGKSEAWEKICIKFATGSTDKNVQAFFMSQLQWIGHSATVDALLPYLSDESLCYPAIAAMRQADPSKAGEVLISALGSLSGKPQIEAVKALGELKVADAGKLLADMSALDNGTDLQSNILRSLAAIGDPASYKALMTEAKAAQFMPEPTGATSVLLEYAAELGQNGNKALGTKIARMLMKKCKDDSQLHFKSQALALYVENSGTGNAMPGLLKAMKDGNKAYRMIAVDCAIRMGGPAAPWISKLEKTKDPEVRAEIIYLLGGLQDRSALPAIRKGLDDPDAAHGFANH